MSRYGAAQRPTTHERIDGGRTLVHAINLAANVDSVLSARPGKRWPHVLRTLGIAALVELATVIFKNNSANR